MYYVLIGIRQPQQSVTFMNINITSLAGRLNLDRMTLGRWIRRYGDYLSPTSNPRKGKSRILNDTDVRVLYLVATLRDAGIDHEEIIARLDKLQADGWQELPDIPSDWDLSVQTISTSQAASRAYELAQVAVLQSELKHVQLALEASQQRERALQERIGELETEKVEISGQREVTEQEKQTLQLDLERTRAQIGELQAQLQAFNLAYGLGRERPISLVVIVGVTALAAATIILIAVVVGSLLT